MNMLWIGPLVGSVWAAEPDAVNASTDEADGVIVVTADRWEGTGQAVPMSVTVISGETLEDAAIVHGEDVLKLVPNMDWVGAGGRPRYLLIRGIGDLGTGNVVTNPTVGVLIDEIDLSGMPAALAMLDVDHVEVLRGPQGTLYGANALGGLLKLESNAPTAEPTLRAELRGGTYGTLTGTLVGGGALTPKSGVVTARLAARLHTTRGFFTNATLDRDDTTYRDELATRLRVRIQPSSRFRLDLVGGYVDTQGGYDHWSIDNSRTTYSDRPGEDSQASGFAAALIRADLGRVRFVSNTSLSTSQWTYAADYDWIGVNTRPPGSLAADDYSIDLAGTQDTRQDGLTQEFRLQNVPGEGPWKDRVRWLAGLYLNRTTQSAETDTTWDGASIPEAFNASEYGRLSLAAFGQTDITFIDRIKLTGGLRVEHAWQSYEDVVGFTDDEARWLFGGRAAITAILAPQASLFFAAAQSSKLGGFNLAPDAPVRVYRPELNRSLELGLRTQDPQGRWVANATGFVVQRDDMQISDWVQRPGGSSADIFFYTDNAQGWNAGAEIEVRGEPMRGLSLEGAVGLLEARIASWTFGEGEGAIDYSGKQQAHAPLATFSFAATWRHRTGAWARAGVTGQSQRFLANNNEIDWPAYAMLDLRLGWQSEHWGVSVWGRNVTNTTYAAAGFGPYFTPNDHVPVGNFFRYGDPGVYGLSVEGRL